LGASTLTDVTGTAFAASSISARIILEFGPVPEMLLVSIPFSLAIL
jgi:hypothetical protein